MNSHKIRIDSGDKIKTLPSADIIFEEKGSVGRKPVGLKELLEFEMLIYNRSGVLVFKTTDVAIGWDGYYKHKLLPQDVYVFIVRGRYNSGQPFQETGNVLLIIKDN